MSPKTLFACLVILGVSIPAKADSDPFANRVKQASTQFDQATKNLDTWQKHHDKVAKQLAKCETAACEKKEGDHLAYKKKKVAQSEEQVADAASQYLEAEEAFKAQHGEYRDGKRVNQIHQAMEFAEGDEDFGDNAASWEALQQRGQKLKGYDIKTPDIGGGREVDPKQHRSYDKGTRDPGVVDFGEDPLAEYQREAAAAAGDTGDSTSGIGMEDGATRASGGKLTRVTANQIHDASAKLASVKALSGRGPLAKTMPLLSGPDRLRDRTVERRRGGEAVDAVRGRREKNHDRIRAGRQGLNSGRYAEALAEANAAIHADKGDPQAWLLRAQAMSGLAGQSTGETRLERFKLAESAAREAIRLSPDSADGYRELAFAQLHLGKIKEALEAASRAIGRDRNDARSYALRAFAHEEMGDREAMLRDLKRAADLDPNRFGRAYQDALNGIRVFDPNARDSRHLFDAMTALPEDSHRDKPPLILLGLLMMGVAVSGFLAAWAWRRLRAEENSGVPDSMTVPEPVKKNDKSKLLGGKYELTRTIGRGAWGQVWEAKDCSLGRLAAIKQIEAAKGDTDGPAPEFHLQEARTIASMQHPNIVDIYEVLELPEGVFLVFEMLEGKTVQQILAERKRLPTSEVRTILGAVASALLTAHKNHIVHRDLKPANIMVTTEGHVKVMDFGIARAIGTVEDGKGIVPSAGEPLRTAATSHLVGTPGYRPPEATEGVVSAAFDLYSLGVCTFEMLVGRRPFSVEGESTPQEAGAALLAVVPGLTPEAISIFAGLLDPDYQRRVSSVQEFIKFLNLLAVPEGSQHSV